eukprot:scaffold272417_cov36-Tisochrysis_lutea.AAC.2
MLFGAIPLFKHAHYGFDWRDALVCIWGGLRGAVGLALALAITSDELIVDCDEVEAAVVADGGCSFAGAARFKRVALLHMCITVGVTLLVNAPSSSLLVKAVGLTKLPGVLAVTKGASAAAHSGSCRGGLSPLAVQVGGILNSRDARGGGRHDASLPHKPQAYVAAMACMIEPLDGRPHSAISHPAPNHLRPNSGGRRFVARAKAPDV